MILKLYPVLTICMVLCTGMNGQYTEQDARAYLDKINKLDIQERRQQTLANWAYDINNNDATLAIMENANDEYQKFEKATWEETTKFNWRTFKDKDIRRQFKLLSDLGKTALPDDDLATYTDLRANMSSAFFDTTICSYSEPKICNLTFSDIGEILSESVDAEEMKILWNEWRTAAGRAIRPMYPEYVDFIREAASANHFNNVLDYWLDYYETEDFEGLIDGVWNQIRPFFLQIHAYIRRKMIVQYGERALTANGPIPAHLTGTLSGEFSTSIYNFTAPYPDVIGPNITDLLIKQNYTPLKLMQIPNDFLKSINLTAMPESFWEKSIITDSTDSTIDCSSVLGLYYFYEPDDVRIINCIDVTVDGLVQSFESIGGAEEMLQFMRNQYYTIYQMPASPGHDGILGELLLLSASLPQYLSKIGLLPDDTTYSIEQQLNDLFYTALSDVLYLPGAYSLELWRWRVFNGEITQDNYNTEWWKLMTAIQGIKPAVKISEEDFDPGAACPIVTSTTPIDTFVQIIARYQFHEALCIKAGQYDPNNPDTDPLHLCSIYGSADAGNTLEEFLKLGASKPWQEATEAVIGQSSLDAGPLLRYFDPLYKWLKEQNKNECIGWQSPGVTNDCTPKV